MAEAPDLTGKRVRCKRPIIQEADLVDGFPEMIVACKGTEGRVVGPSPSRGFDWVVHMPTTAIGAPPGFTEDVHVCTDEIEVLGDAN